MRPILKFIAFTSLMALSCLVIGAEQDRLKAFPVAQQGMQRIVITLPAIARGEDQRFRVELAAGKEMLTDGVNLVRLGSSITAHPLKGWGYTYYEVNESSAMTSTLMAVPEGTPKVKQFVHADSLTIDYNSRLPIVVYIPEGYQLRYRIWEAPLDYHTAEQG